MSNTGTGIGKISDIYQNAAEDKMEPAFIANLMQINMKNGFSSLEISFENGTGKTALGGFNGAGVPLNLAQQAVSMIGQVVQFEYKNINNTAMVTKINPIKP